MANTAQCAHPACQCMVPHAWPDLHIWPMSTTEAALTAHLVMPGGHPGDEFLVRMQQALAHDHGIEHVTLQIEISEDIPCLLHDENCV